MTRFWSRLGLILGSVCAVTGEVLASHHTRVLNVHDPLRRDNHLLQQRRLHDGNNNSNNQKNEAPLSLSSLRQHQQRRLQSDIQGRQSVTGFVDPAVCYPALSNSDTDGDRLISAEEYVSFAQSMGPAGLLGDDDNAPIAFEDLPTVLQSNFFDLACLCESDANDNSCCEGENAVITADGSFPDEVPTEDQESYLFIVCSFTTNALDKVLFSDPPTSVPSVKPTLVPTATLSEEPTLNPTTLSPTVIPGSPTSTPTLVPTTMPMPVEVPIEVMYRIGVQVGGESDIYLEELVIAMDAITPEVLVQVLEDNGSRRTNRGLLLRSRYLAFRGGRRLSTVQIPSTAFVVEELECPTSAMIAEDDTCERIVSSMILQFEPNEGSNIEATSNDFRLALQQAIAGGTLADALQESFPESLIYIIDDSVLDAVDRAPAPPVDEDDSISSGGVFGIAAGAFIFIVLLLGFFTRRSNKEETPPPELEPVTPEKEIKAWEPPPSLPPKKEVPVITTTPAVSSTAAVDEPTTPAVDEPTPAVTAAVAVTAASATAIAAASYGGKDQDAMMDNDEALAVLSLDASSNAGSSGWSSSAGVSSLNTGDEDTGSHAAPSSSAFGSTLKALGMDLTSPQQPSSTIRDVAKAAGVTRADLDSAIEQGDWAAVGATAALLAAASDSQSFSSSQSTKLNTSETQNRSENYTLDAERAAELDQLVQSGDWEGVVLAAAKYEASVDSVDESSARSTQSSVTNESRSVRKVQEYREEVTELVRRVVPDELPNVEEMMEQFRGREEELIETLRTMEERAVAQKARDAGQKQAKTEAKQKTSQQRAAFASAMASSINSPSRDVSSREETDPEKTPPSMVKSLGIGMMSVLSKSLGTGQVVGTAKSKSMGTGEIVDTKENKNAALEHAIETGDWQAVSEAAAMISDHSVASSVETDEILRLAEGASSQGSVSSKGDLSYKADELEELIERGDWTGVVNAAAGMSSAAESSKRQAGGGTTEEETRRQQRRLKQRKEEEDAIAAADIWDAIAEQTKKDTSNMAPGSDEAAREAADWAIGRSLLALVRAGNDDAMTRDDSTSGRSDG